MKTLILHFTWKNIYTIAYIYSSLLLPLLFYAINCLFTLFIYYLYKLFLYFVIIYLYVYYFFNFLIYYTFYLCVNKSFYDIRIKYEILILCFFHNMQQNRDVTSKFSHIAYVYRSSCIIHTEIDGTKSNISRYGVYICHVHGILETFTLQAKE